jgi:hypothetical protein
MVSVGGNAAKMLHWCARGQYSDATPVAGRFKGVLEKASGFPPGSFDIIISDEPKCEVAYGLVIDDLKLQGSERREEVIAGEAFVTSDGKDYTWEQLLDWQLLKQGLLPSPDRLKEFLAIAKPPEALGPSFLGDISGFVGDELIRLKGREGRQVHIEPIFIIELREYLRRMARSWANKYRANSPSASR